MTTGANLFWLTPVLPLGVFALLACGLSRRGRLASRLAVASLVGSVFLSGLGLYAAARGARTTVATAWLVVGGRRLELALWLDPLAALIATLVSVVGLVVFIYAASYMACDPHRGRFFAELSLFIGSMLMLVLAADLLTLFIAWELLGLCSYLLIGFWFEKQDVPSSATKAFVTTRIGDLAMLVGILLLVGVAEGSRIDLVLGVASGGGLAQDLLLASALLLFAGAASKSAQIPFQGWLPDAMVGPTPVSALLHSATMVAAGVFLIARLYPLFLASGSALKVVAWVGVTTAFLGAAAALVQTDLKRLLAYSTMSQLGLMFVGLGAGSLLAGVLLLVAQALYKALLFLAAGAVDHAVGGTAFERMGGLARHMPQTFVVFAVTSAALAGLPVTLALPPKDPVLAGAWQAHTALFAAALLASVMTALYSARALGLVFLGASSEKARQAHEAPPGLLTPMFTLTGLTVGGLLINAAVLGRPLAKFLGSETPEAGAVTALALAAAVVGAGLGLWSRVTWPETIVWPWLKSAAPVFDNEFGFIPVYRALTRASLWLANTTGAFDRRTFDPVSARLAAAIGSFIGGAARFDSATFEAVGRMAAQGTLRLIRSAGTFDLQRLEAGVREFAEGVLCLSQRVRRVQTGRIENYLLAIFIWALVVIAAAVVSVTLRR